MIAGAVIFVYRYVHTEDQGPLLLLLLLLLLGRGPLIAKCTQYVLQYRAAAAIEATREAAGASVGSSLAVGPAGRACERNGSGEGAVGLVVSMGVGAWRFSSPV